MNAAELIARGQRVVRLEREALERVECGLGESFARAVELLAAATGRVLVSGIGKSGLIARKIAATLTSTGTNAAFLHPVDSLHGDIGVVGPADAAVLISKSGETPELFPLMEQLERCGVPIIAITGAARSTLGCQANATLDGWVAEEACPHDLAPTTSTTAALALGDALAIVLLERKGFRREDFAQLHPGGALGRRLFTRVRDLMVSEQLPLLAPDGTMREAVVLLAERRGTVAVVDAGQHVLGTVTAGDLTRLMEHEEKFLHIAVSGVMNPAPKVARADELASAAVHRMERYGVMAMPVLDDEARVVGMVHLHDLMRGGVA